MSVVGTSQYMAPEVISGKKYDARCDWWGVGVILYECLYGYTPFMAEEGRQQTKKNIIHHHQTFCFPTRPVVSRRCRDLMASLITDKEYRLCSKRYCMKDLTSSAWYSPSAGSGTGSSCKMRNCDFAGRFVFPYDAEDIKAHKWFRSIPWERLHELRPPLIPQLRSVEDTRYFDGESSTSDWTESSPEEDTNGGELAQELETVNELQSATQLQPDGESGWNWPLDPPTVEGSPTPHHHSPPHLQSWAQHGNHPSIKSPPIIPPPPYLLEPPIVAKGDTLFLPPFPPLEFPSFTPKQINFLRSLRPTLQGVAYAAIAGPHDVDRLEALDMYLERLLPGATGTERAQLRQFIRRYGRRERKRPRDPLLRDERTRRVAMDVRKRTAFLGYEWKRMSSPSLSMAGKKQEGGYEMGMGTMGGDGCVEGYDVLYKAPQPQAQRQKCQQHGLGGFQRWEQDVAALRALHRGQWSLR